MLFFTNQNTITVKRQVYTGNKSTLTTVSGTFKGYLKPLSEEQAQINGLQYGQGYALITEVDSTIAVGDELTINSTVYKVRGMANHNRGGFTAYKRYLLTLPSA